MELRDVIFQGVWGHDKAARLSVEPGELTTIETPPDVEADQVIGVLVALLYPDSDDGRRPDWLREAGGAARLGVIANQGDRTYRLLRASTPESLRLQTKRPNGFEQEAKGVEAVTRTLDEMLGRPSLGEFLVLNCWAFGRASQQLTMRVSETHEFSRSERRTLEAYRRAKRAERLEDELGGLEEERDQLRETWGEVFEREEKLRQAAAERKSLEHDRLDDEQLELLRHKETRVERLERKLEQLEERADSTRRAAEESAPTPPWHNRVFWGGLAAGVVAVGAGIWFEESHRWLMLLDAVGFGVALFVALKYLTRLERAGVHNVRLESTRRRSREIRQELVDLQERVDHILTHAEAETEAELIDKNERAEQLESTVERLERQLADVRDDDSYQDDRARLRTLERQMQTKRSELDDLRGSTPPVFELENQLHEMGINPKAGLERLEAHRSGSSGEGHAETEPLRRVCERVGVCEAGQLTQGRLTGMWQKICGHVLGEPFSSVMMVDGHLELGEGGRDAFDEAAPSQSVARQQVLMALAFAAHAATASRSPGVSTLWVRHPRHLGRDVDAAAWDKVLGQARGSFGVGLLR
jgi:TolA-binding protein